MQKSEFSDAVRKAIFKYFENNEDPVYLYEKSRIKSNCKTFLQIPYQPKKIHFATMANINPTFLEIIKDEGINVFVNSLPHLRQVQNLGYSGEQIIFTASALNEETMKIVSVSGAAINLDSLNQIDLWNKASGGKSFGIRCNIGNLVKPKSTPAGYFLGKSSRLGLSVSEMKSLKGNNNVKGLHLYVGTDIMEVDYFIDCYRKLGKFVKWYPDLEYLDLGGGFGLDDNNLSHDFEINEFGIKLNEFMQELNKGLVNPLDIVLEPGRILGGKAGYFACRVTDVKLRNGKQLIGVNASVSQFPRPLFYPDTAFHPFNIFDSSGEERANEEIVSFIHGCSTYSRDYLARNICTGRARPGDVVVFGNSGSYCASSYTEFLGFPKPEEIYI